MRKHLSRVMAALLVLAMALTMLPVVSAAKERFTATPIDGIPESGQTFVIYSAPCRRRVLAGGLRRRSRRFGCFRLRGVCKSDRADGAQVPIRP